MVVIEILYDKALLFVHRHEDLFHRGITSQRLLHAEEVNGLPDQVSRMPLDRRGQRSKEYATLNAPLMALMSVVQSKHPVRRLKYDGLYFPRTSAAPSTGRRRLPNKSRQC